MSLNKQITINEMLSAITKHRRKAMITFLILMALVLAVFVMVPRKYGSEGRLFVQLGRAGTNLNPSMGSPSMGSPSISIQDSRETEIRSVAELVGSRAIIEPVIEEIGPKAILDSPFEFLRFNFWLPTMPWNSVERADELAQNEYVRLHEFELAAKELERSLVVHSEKKTSIISIYCKAHSPALAQKIVEEIMAQTQLKHLDVHAVKGSTAFFGENFKRKESTLIAAEKQLRDFRNDNSFLSLEGAVATQQNVINKLELELIDAEVNCAQSKKRLENIRNQLAGIMPTVELPRSGIEKLSTEDSHTELFKLESEMKQLEAKYNQDHPRLKSLQESVAAIKAGLKTMPTDRTESEIRSNPVFENVKVALVIASAELSAFQARWENLAEKHQQSIEQLEQLNNKAIRASQLQRELSMARQEMDIYIRKLTESAVVDELDQKRISDVVVAQRANFVVKPVSPRGSVLVPLGAMLSVICAIGTALYFEKDLLGGHLSEEEVEQILEIPILVSLPTVPAQRNMVG